MSITLAQLRTSTYAILREEEDASNYPYTLVDSFLNSWQLDFCSGLIKNPFTGEIIKKGKLPFLNTDKYYSNIAPITLSTDTTIWATTLTVSDTTNYPSSGKIYLGSNVITYTGKTGTTFTGCTNVLFARQSGTQISPIFDLPTDFMSAIQIIYNNRYKLECKEYDDVYSRLQQYKSRMPNQEYSATVPFTSGVMMDPFYTIKDWAYLLLRNLTQTEWVIHMRYEKAPTTLSATSDTATIDNDIYARNILPQYAAAQMLYYRWEEARAKEIFNYILPLVKQAYNYYNNKWYESQSWYSYSVNKSGRIYNI